MLPMLKIRTLAPAAALAAALLCAPAFADVLATVNGTQITNDDLQAALEQMAPSLPAQLKGKARDNYVLDYLIDLQLVAGKGEADKLGDTQEFKAQLELLRKKALMQAEMTNVAKTAISDAVLQKTYDEAKAKQKPIEEVHARHILVPTEADAQAVEKRLKGGEDFIKVAEAVSKDPSAPGGDLGWFTKDKMVPEFANAAFAMKVGDISDPIKTKFGWHVIKLEGTRTQPFPAFDAVKSQISNYVLQKAQTEFILGLRKDSKIVRTVPESPAPESPALDATPPAPTK